MNKLSILNSPRILLPLLLMLGIGLGYSAWPLITAANKDRIQTPSAIDIGFAQSMSLHHQQAISMAQIMLNAPEQTPLKRLSQNIAYSQLRELGKMEGWLELWGKSALIKPERMSWMLLGQEPPSQELLQYLIDCDNSPTGMTGLATVQELDELRRLEGRARDRQFLQLMLAHHKGGLPMAKFAAANAQTPALQKLASLMAMEQAEELIHMQRALAVIEASGD